MNLIKLWKARNQIMEGITNSIFTRADVEQIAAERQVICTACEHLDTTGESCIVHGSQPCCGKCGCKLAWKTRSLSSECPLEGADKRWEAVMNITEEQLLKNQLGES
jgi:hypothetical protein